MSLYHRKEERVKIKESSLQLARRSREMRIPLLRIPSFHRIVIPSISSFRAKREIFLAHR